MTRNQVIVLSKCMPHPPAVAGLYQGLSANFAQQAGYTRQINWLISHKMIRKRHGRYVATRVGKRIYEYQVSR